jgi:aspartate ammonia-lyase
VRTETDSLGERQIPDEAYWGIHTARAVDNFPISKRPISVYPELVVALASVKQAAARANLELGVLSPDKAALIDAACAEVIGGRLHEQFVVGVIQGGAGTSTNMNANEVIANRALELGGHEKGEYGFLSPLDDVNRSQSTNDVYPTAIKIAMMYSLASMLGEMRMLRDAFAAKSVEFAHILKIGRTQLQDAVPLTLGQEFHGWATTMSEDIDRITDTLPLLSEINLGATAIGTGINADPRYAAAVRQHLSEITGLDLVTASDLIEATSDTGVFMTFSSALKRAAVKLSKICNDLRLLSSGPQAGLGEISLPPKQAGSSIMPGKVNPVIPEAVNQVAFSVAGADVTVTMAVEAGQLQLNAFEPVILHSLVGSITHLAAACRVLAERCVRGITVNGELTRAQVERSIGLVTALNPEIGYVAATEIARDALSSGRGVAELILERGLVSPERLAHLLRPEQLAHPASTPGAAELVASDGDGS